MTRPIAHAAAVAGALALSGCGGAAHATSTATPSGTAPRAITVTETQAQPAAPKHRHRAQQQPPPDPGTLPQTDVHPSAETGGFHAEMRALWQAVSTGDAEAGRSAFFPEGAYVQVKAIADPGGDYTGRLLGGYAADIAAAHALLAAHSGAAHLLRVSVTDGYAHWVPPAVCANRVGYWEVPNARVVYAQAGVERSFGVASMISWRGVWYVVHLGAVVPAGAGGAVDDPELGPGVSAPSSTC